MRRTAAPDDPTEAQLDAVFFALASEPRRRMLDALKAAPGSTVGAVAAHFDGELGRFAVMKHLATLEAAGLVIAERSGRERWLWFDPTPIQWVHERWTTEFSAYFAARLTRLKFMAEGAEVHPFPAPKKQGRSRG
jgi:DNA-binding transcriptional ArsR family regulator